jgi:adenylate kinase family enzyme
MDRIAIIGCGGSGKTHLAHRMAVLLNLPRTHLDGIYYNADWNPLPHEDFATLQRDLVARPQWIIDGNYASTLPIRLATADTVIFLDLPAITCLTSVVRRRLRYRGGQHTQDGIYDRLTWNFIRYIWTYRTAMRPRIRQLLDQHGRHAQLIILTSRRQVTRFVSHLAAESETRT